MKIYVASSWQNIIQPNVVSALREEIHEVYDFRQEGLSWTAIDPNWKSWEETDFSWALLHPIARDSYERDMKALDAADVVVLVLPSGRSAHLEAGYAHGRGKPLVIYCAYGALIPELMYRMADYVVFTIADIARCLKQLGAIARDRAGKS